MRKKLSMFILIMFMLLNIIGCNNKQLDNQKGLKFQCESNHFMFYCEDKDTKSLKDFEKYLELAYLKITDDFNVKFNKKIDVKIYTDIKTFHDDVHSEDAPNWYVGTANFGDVRIVSPLNPPKEMNYLNIIAVSIHEFTHLVLYKASTAEIRSIYWINEGIATYEAKQKLDNKTKQKIYNEAINNRLPKINQLEYEDNQIDLQYSYAYSMVEYVIKKYGLDKLNKFIKKDYLDNDFVNIFGVSKDKFELGWHDYIIHNYKIK